MSRFSIARNGPIQSQGLVAPCDTYGVRDHTACASLHGDEQRRLASIMTTIEVGPQSAIFNETDPADHVFNLTAGSVKIFKLLSDGRREITGFLFPGDFLGLTHNEAYAYSAETLTTSRLCRFPRHKLEALLDELPTLERQLLGMASHELAAAQDQMMLLGRKSARERVASFLLLMSATAARRGNVENTVSLPMNRGDIADYLGLTVETISRTLGQLKTKGLIQMPSEKQILLAKRDALQEISG